MATVFSPPIVPLPPFLLPFFLLSPCIQTRPSFFVPPVFPKPETLVIICHSCFGCRQSDVAGPGPCLEICNLNMVWKKWEWFKGAAACLEREFDGIPKQFFSRQRTYIKVRGFQLRYGSLDGLCWRCLLGSYHIPSGRWHFSPSGMKCSLRFLVLSQRTHKVFEDLLRPLALDKTLIVCCIT
ncbi:hypothetical protein GBA52_024431 [Prunus armeniaca]|nr:hypothetical protein GBA52_024431 [Prunus armeniaca]